MKSKKIKLNEKEVEIKAIPFRKVLEVLKYIKTLPEKVKSSLAEIDLGKDKEVDSVAALGVFADLLSDSEEEILEILALASGMSPKDIGDLSISDMTKLLKVLLEVNDIDEIKKEFGELGKMFNQKTK